MARSEHALTRLWLKAWSADVNVSRMYLVPSHAGRKAGQIRAGVSDRSSLGGPYWLRDAGSILSASIGLGSATRLDPNRARWFMPAGLVRLAIVLPDLRETASPASQKSRDAVAGSGGPKSLELARESRNRVTWPPTRHAMEVVGNLRFAETEISPVWSRLPVADYKKRGYHIPNGERK